MEGLSSVLWMVLGLATRFGLPILMTALVILGLRKLDEIWQSSASEASLAQARVQVENCGCWGVKDCPEEKRLQCAAYNCQEMPCWQVFRDSHGQMKEACLGCEVFRSAPVPA